MAIAAPKSNDTNLVDLLGSIHKGETQLPDFQRKWTWDDARIKGLIASLTQGYPMGALMQLEYGSEEVKFKYRTIEGAPDANVAPRYLVMDGQQRLTSMYRSLFSKDVVVTTNEKHVPIERYYYLDINACLDPAFDRVDAIVSVPKDRKIKENFDRDIKLDLSTAELEYENEMYPANILFDQNATVKWLMEYLNFHGNSPEAFAKYTQFNSDVVSTVASYRLPVITMDKSTPREAVCKVFENVNTGGVSLTVFELVTATFATYEFDLRGDWEKIKRRIHALDKDIRTDVMESIDETAFLTAITLYTNYKHKRDGKSIAVSCKKKDVLDLSFESYQTYKESVIEGFELAREFLLEQAVFRKRDLPYTTQLIPLAAIAAYVGRKTFKDPVTQTIVSRWYWCGIFGEMYGGSNETRYCYDIEDVVAQIENNQSEMRTINGCHFQSTRLLGLQSRQSAAYKGIMALLYKSKALDFSRGISIDIVNSMEMAPDIHHIFPQSYCEKMGLDKRKWNSVINKTPLLPETNREIGGSAPSVYAKRILSKSQISEDVLKERIASHKVDWVSLTTDSFEEYFQLRAMALLDMIEDATGKAISDRTSEETIKQFGYAL
jgi:hypothetical protein